MKDEQTTGGKARDELIRGLKDVFSSFNQTGLFWLLEAERSGRTNIIKKTGLDVAALTNAVLECTLIHLRSLDDFFSISPKARPDDMKASDYGYKDGKGAFLTAEDRVAINKHLMHLSWVRAKEFRGHFVINHNRAVINRMIGFMEFLISDFLRADEPEHASLTGALATAKKHKAGLDGIYT